MPRNLILVANASRARILETDRAMKDVKVLDALEHPESRAHVGELGHDRPGRFNKSGATRSAYEPHTSPHDVQTDQFARQLARRFEERIREQPSLPAILVASPEMLGRIRPLLDATAHRQVFLEVSHDYTGLTSRDLLEVLRVQV